MAVLARMPGVHGLFFPRVKRRVFACKKTLPAKRRHSDEYVLITFW